MKIGVLDIQGSVEEHLKLLSSLKEADLKVVRVKNVSDLEGLRGLIMPGGESTTISKLLDRFDLRKEIITRVKEGMALWGTCAGAILICREIIGDSKVAPMNLIDIAVERNAYGRQMDSFETQVEFDLGKGAMGRVVPAICIRAPKLVMPGKNVKILATYDGEIMAVREGKVLATNFHPELSEDLEVHRYFVEMCK
ncbi:pyridoxal 5'-phosphate synthase glutaminase subunit PdxT [Candidatus Peregrinibacteria bacterium]|nr:pyridoxal 5'-phosphate synthase glutaminase subunit PdxT [Candidatus Peregrinibacteria bacterium]